LKRRHGPPPQRSRLEETYEGYARSPRARRKWAADNPGNIEIRAELLDAIVELAAIQLSGDGPILDIGCGGGWLLEALVERGITEKRLFGVDLIPNRVEAARRRAAGADVRRADARSLPYENRSFAVVAMLTSLSSMGGPEGIEQALAEAARVVASDGLVLCYEPRLWNPFNRATVLVGSRQLRSALGPPVAVRALTGFPPLSRRLGSRTALLYPSLARLAPTHRLSAHSPT
jgi:SAM-dependent methyltransferase